MKTVRIGLLGCGTVGGGVVKLLTANATMLSDKLGAELHLAAVVDRSLPDRNQYGVGAELLSRDPWELVRRSDIDVVVELFGGEQPAGELILAALAAGKDVVTANKTLLAKHGERIFAAAAEHRSRIGFEASVGGGIPIIRTLRDGLAADRQRAVYGIVNGTCNYILTTMSEGGMEFSEVLALAQKARLAEADPSLDVEGHDAAHKLCLLVTLAFGAAIKPAQVYTEGIRAVTAQDISYARQLGYTIKLLAIAKLEEGVIEARVHPTMLPSDHILADVGGAFNAIYIQGEALGSTLYSGQGAGEMPTATAVVADLLELARMRLAGTWNHPLGYPIDKIQPARVKPMQSVVCEYYLRFMAEDKPGVLGQLASVLGRHRISIASVIQQERAPQVMVPVVMRTHDTPEHALTAALAEIRAQTIVAGEPCVIRIEERL